MCPPGLFDRPAEAPPCSAHHSPEPPYSPRCLLSLQSRRWLGDRKPYCLVDPHVGVSVSHRSDRHSRLHWLRLAYAGENNLNGMNLYFDSISWTVAGRKIEVIKEDDQFNRLP